MPFFQNKKSLVKETLVGILILTAGFLLILVIAKTSVDQAEAKTAESICKGSVVLREKTYTEIYDPLIGEAKLGSVASPLLCRTIEKRLPDDKDASREQVKRDFANLMASCWNQFGEGLIDDVFKEGDLLKNNCFVCYTINLRQTSNFNLNDRVSAEEFLQYIFEQPYKVSERPDSCKFNGGYCISSENKENCPIKADVSYIDIDKKSPQCRQTGNPNCCYTDYECWNQGGICSSANPEQGKYFSYAKWRCPSNMQCFVEQGRYFTYGDYIQRFGGEGKIVVDTDITPEEIYAISFGSPTKTCSLCEKLGLLAGVAGFITKGGLILKIVKGTAGFSISSAVSHGAASAVIGIKELFSEREFSTVYLTTLNTIQQEKLCTLVQET